MMSELQQVYKIIPSGKFLDDIEKIKRSGQKILTEKIIALLEEIRKHPSIGIGQVEQLKYYNRGVIYSRRINKQHRLVYEILEDSKVVIILSVWGHYNDK